MGVNDRAMTTPRTTAIAAMRLSGRCRSSSWPEPLKALLLLSCLSSAASFVLTPPQSAHFSCSPTEPARSTKVRRCTEACHASLPWYISQRGRIPDIAGMRGVLSQHTHSTIRRLSSSTCLFSSSSLKDDTFSSTSSSSFSRSQVPLNNSQPVSLLEPTDTTITDPLLDLRQRHSRGERLSQQDCDNVLAYCVASDEWDSVLDVLDVMHEQGWTQALSSYKACLSACHEKANPASALDILNAMSSAGFSPSVDEVGLVVQTMCRRMRQDEMMSVSASKSSSSLTEPSMWIEEIQSLLQDYPNVSLAVYNDMISYLMDSQKWREGVRLLRQMEEGNSTRPSAATYHAVVEGCLFANQLDLAVQVLQSAIEKSIKPTTSSFELAIVALSKRLQWRLAVQLFDLMTTHDIEKNIQMYNAVLNACSKAREDIQARNLLVQMRKQGIKPNILSFNYVISASANAGRWKEALSVLDQCHREPGVQPDIYTYTNAIRACAKGESSCGCVC
jgi:pentatricopeptide repeat protein